MLVPVGFAYGQESRGTIIGRVTDSTRAIIPGVRVRAVNMATNAGSSTLTNQNGNFELPYLLPGVYRVTAEAPGFKAAVRDKIELRVSDRLALDLVLEIGEVTESVVVTGETPLLESTNASIGMVMYEQQVQELPVVGGNPFYLSRLSPGVLSTGGRSAGNPMDQGAATDNIVNGTRNASEASVDGAPNVAERAAVFSPPQDLVQEFKIHTATFDAGIGHAAGGTTNVSIKSGTNELHGTGYFNDSRLRAVPWFTNRFIYDPTTGPINEDKKARALQGWRHRRWGGTITAPVVIPKVYNGRNRTFWSFGYEKLYILRNLSGTYTVPSPAMKNGDLSELLAAGSRYQVYDPLTTVPSSRRGRFERQPIPGNIIPASRIDPIAQKILAYYPDPNQQGTVDGRQNFYRTRDIDRNNRTIVHRIDHTISDNHRFFVRWNNSQHDNFTDTLPTVATRNILDRTGWGLVLDDVYAVSPQLIVNVRYGLTYQNPHDLRGTQGFDLTTLGLPQSLVSEIATRADPAGFTFPQVVIDGGAYTQIGNNGGQNRKMIYHNFAGTVTKVSGDHSFRMGADVRILRENGAAFGNVSPRYNFTQSYTRGPLDNSPTAPIGQGLASMLLGIPTGGQVNVNASRAEQSTYWGLFLHDDWRVTRKLTLNAGVRWEYEGPTTERYNRSIRGFDFDVESPVAAQARANYAKNPIPEIPVEQFQVMGGLLFPGVGGQPRGLWDGDRNNFAPRVGMAYRLNNATILRAGYGIFFDIIGVDRQGVNQGGFNQPTNIIASIDNGQTYQASTANPFPNGIEIPRGAADGAATFLGREVSFFNSEMVNPYMQRWSLAIQRELPGRLVLETAYIGNRGTKLSANREFSATPAEYLSTLPVRDQATIDHLSEQVPNPFFGIAEFVGTGLGNRTISRGNLLKPYPHFGGITANMPFGYSWFHSLQTRVEKRMSNGLTFQMAWTYSKYMDAIAYLNDSDLRPEEVISENDYTHRFVLNGIYELPFGRGRRFLTNANSWVDGLLGGWQFQGWFEGQSGQALGFGNAIFNGDLGDVSLPVGDRRAERWFNVDAGFERDSKNQLASNIRGLSTRFNGIRGDGINNFDLSMFKNFRLTERFRLQYRFETFNTLNHIQFANPNTTPQNTAFGTITGEKGHGQRQVTMGLKLMF
jgi:hypothetical protein